MTPVQEGWHPSVEGKKLQHAGEGVHIHVCGPVSARVSACFCGHVCEYTCVSACVCASR